MVLLLIKLQNNVVCSIQSYITNNLQNKGERGMHYF